VLGVNTVQWGLAGDIPAPADFTRDGKAERAVWRPFTGEFWILGFPAPIKLGQPGDVPAPADFDGNGRTDVAVWRPSNGTWYYLTNPC
jgi:hypothetical protein